MRLYLQIRDKRAPFEFVETTGQSSRKVRHVWLSLVYHNVAISTSHHSPLINKTQPAQR